MNEKQIKSYILYVLVLAFRVMYKVIVLSKFRCYAMLGDFRQAAIHCEVSIETVRQHFGSKSIEYGHELHKLAQLLFNGQEVEKALTVIKPGVQILTLHYGEKNEYVEELIQMKKILYEIDHV